MHAPPKGFKKFRLILKSTPLFNLPGISISKINGGRMKSQIKFKQI
jgi:hypothetical protein